jgi:hypothetical protein
MPMCSPYRRQTLYVSTPLPDKSKKKHYYVVLTDPIESTNIEQQEVAWVSWESFVDSPLTDKSCTLEIGDHSSIKWKSCVNYTYAEIISVNMIQEKIKNGTIQEHPEPISEKVYEKILKGLYQSEYTNHKVENFCRIHAPKLLNKYQKRQIPKPARGGYGSDQGY